MSHAADLNDKYDRAAPAWGDKMRLLGYYDAYLGLLSSPNFRAPDGNRVIDIGCGTGALAEAWVAIQGPSQDITLLDPSKAMLKHAETSLQARNVQPTCVDQLLDTYTPDRPFHCLLAAHVIEHTDTPVAMLKQIRDIAEPDARLWLIVSKPHWCNAIIWLQWRHRAYTAPQVETMLNEAGWSLEMEYAFPSGPPSRTSRGYLAKPI